MLYFMLGLISGTIFLEPLIINFIYFSNVALFNDIILTKKNSNKLQDYFERRKIKMRMTDLMNELFTNFKIEKWNKDKSCWEHYRGYISHNSARCAYTYLLKNSKGIYRLIKVIEIDERH